MHYFYMHKIVWKANLISNLPINWNVHHFESDEEPVRLKLHSTSSRAMTTTTCYAMKLKQQTRRLHLHFPLFSLGYEESPLCLLWQMYSHVHMLHRLDMASACFICVSLAGYIRLCRRHLLRRMELEKLRLVYSIREMTRFSIKYKRRKNWLFLA